MISIGRGGSNEGARVRAETPASGARHAMAETAGKLVHPLEEVRRRSLQTLRSKIEAGLLSASDLGQPVLSSLLRLVRMPQCAAGEQLSALDLLRLLAADTEAARQLVGLGAVEILRELHDASPEKEPVRTTTAQLVDTLTGIPGAQRPAVEAWTPPRHDAPKLLAAVNDVGPPPASRALNFMGGTPTDSSRIQLPTPSWMRLRSPPLARADEQTLFEATVRLQMSEVRILRETCDFVGGQLAHDMPAAAILQRPAVLQGLLSLLRTTELAEMSELNCAALGALDAVVDAVLAGLREHADQRLDSLRAVEDDAHVTEAATSGERNAGAGTKAWKGQASQHGTSGPETGWAAWQLAHAVWEAVVPMLRHPNACTDACPLLMRLLPLLYTPPPTASPEVIGRAAKLWQCFFSSLSAVLRFHGLLSTEGDEPEPATVASVLASSLEPTLLPVVLLALAATAACPLALMHDAMPPCMTALLGRVAADPYFAICEPPAHRIARQSLAQLNPEAAHMAAYAETIENAAARALSLRSVPRLPGEHAAWALRRCELLESCLPALSYAHLPSVPAEIVQLTCSAPAEITAALESLLVACIAHPVTWVRELTLSRMLGALSELVPGREIGPLLDDETGAANMDAEVAAAIAAEVAAEVEASHEERADAAEALVHQMLRPRMLRVLVEAALPSQLETASASRDARLAQSLLLAALPHLLQSGAAGVEGLDALPALLPRIQAHLMPASSGTDGRLRAADDLRTQASLTESIASATDMRARALLSLVLPAMGEHSRLAADLRMLLHHHQPLAAAAAQHLAPLLQHPPPASLPEAPLHGLVDPDKIGALRRAPSNGPAASGVSKLFDDAELTHLLEMIGSNQLEMRIRIAATQQFAHLAAERTVLERSLGTGLLSTLMRTLEDCVCEADAEAGPLVMVLLQLFDAVLRFHAETREAVLASTPVSSCHSRGASALRRGGWRGAATCPRSRALPPADELRCCVNVAARSCAGTALAPRVRIPLVCGGATGSAARVVHAPFRRAEPHSLSELQGAGDRAHIDVRSGLSGGREGILH